MPPAPKLQPALFGGLFIGVLSALPIISLGNCICCMWIVGGGALAVYLMQQNYPYAVTAADGALVGLMAGVIGGVIGGVLLIPIMLAFGPFQQRILERIIASNPDIPEQTRNMIQQMAAGGAVMGIAALIKIVFGVCIDAVFAMLGGLLGVALFKKKDLPPPGTAQVIPTV
jgi:small-conductance mechanosensitive channel